MSYWSGYDDQLNGGFPICNPEYVPYYNNMPYFSDPTRPNYGVVNSGYNFYDAQPSYQNNYLEQPGTSQVTNNFAPNVAGDDAGTSQNDVNKNSGTVKKKSNERNRYWNNGRKNERYGSGRTFNRSKPDPRKAEVDEGNGDDVREAKSKNKQGQKQDGKNYYQYNRYRNSYDDRRSNYRGRDNRFEGYDNRGYGKYGKQSSKNYDGGDYGANGRDESARDKNNWRSSNCNRKCNSSNVRKKLDAASQRERLEQMLSRRMLECLVCCEKIKHTDKIWTCEQCYHILHLNCIIAWANSSKLENGWRCPACQNVCSDIPKHYTCYCGKTQEPRPVPGVVPHACGELCMKNRRSCDHKCTILCHPGPCPDCNVMVAKPCGCGATSQTVKCSSDTEIVCNSVCDKKLECGLHKCHSQCHTGLCMPCGETLRQECFCGKVGRKVNCTGQFMGAKSYSCEEVCGKSLACGNHKCEKICHEGACEACPRDVDLIRTCPCGRTQLKDVRKSCLDPIPSCDKRAAPGFLSWKPHSPKLDGAK